MDFFRHRKQQRIAPRKGLTKYALESRLVPFTEGVLNAIIGLRIFISKHQREDGKERNTAFIIANYKRRCESEQKRKQTRMRIGWKCAKCHGWGRANRNKCYSFDRGYRAKYQRHLCSRISRSFEYFLNIF